MSQKTTDRAAAWRKANPEKARAIQAKYREKNRDKTNAAVAATAKRFREEHGHSIASHQLSQRIKKDPVRAMITRQRGNARYRGLEFTITEADITIPDVCPILKVPFVFERAIGRKNRNPLAPSIDRIDSTKGYVPGNVAVISFRANFLKGSLSLSDARAILEYIETNLDQQQSSTN